MSAAPAAGCPLCREAGGVPVWQGARFRVIRAEEPDFPAFYRLVWTDHVAEFSDLATADRHACADALAAIEQVLRRELRPTKVNIASLGNLVPHLHWHLIARFDWDSRFPQPVWAPAERALAQPALERLALPLADLDRAVAAALH